MGATTNKNPKFTFIIPSYNRFDKLTNLLNQIKGYDNTSVIIFNDASIDKRYETLPSIFNNLTIINNRSNNGKKLYSNTVISLLNSAENTDFDYVVMLADDFILCDNFIELLSGIVNEYDIINIFSIHESNWTYRGWIDGAFACSKNAMSIIKNKIKPTISGNNGMSTGVWKGVTTSFWKDNGSKYKLVTLNYSLTQHDGNDDSKLHPVHRLKTPIVARNFYNNFYGNEIKIIGDSTIKQTVQKKKDTSSGNSIATPNISKTPNVSKTTEIEKTPVESKPKQSVVNSPIEFDKTRLNSIKKSLNQQNQSRINKITDDVFLAKTRKRNLRLGGR